MAQEAEDFADCSLTHDMFDIDTEICSARKGREIGGKKLIPRVHFCHTRLIHGRRLTTNVLTILFLFSFSASISFGRSEKAVGAGHWSHHSSSQ